MTTLSTRNHIGQENKTVSTAAVSLSGVTGKRPRHVLIYVGSAPIRWRADGTDPTSTTGMYVAAGAYLDWTGVDDYSGMISKLRLIRDTSASGDATLAVSYFD